MKLTINPYLNFNGTCEEAFNFYARVLGGKIEGLFPFAGTPVEGHIPAEWKSKIMHATLIAHGQVIMGSDAPPGQFQKAQGLWVSLNVDTAADADRIFKEFSTKGTVIMPIQQTFWAERFGMCIDSFGTPWIVKCQKPH